MTKVKVRVVSEYEVLVNAPKEEAEALVRKELAVWTKTDHLSPTGRFELRMGRGVESGPVKEWDASATSEVLSVEECV